MKKYRILRGDANVEITIDCKTWGEGKAMFSTAMRGLKDIPVIFGHKKPPI